MRTTTLGELTVSAQGLGCMGMSEFYGHTDWDESVASIHRALDHGVTFLDTADIYGAGDNEVLVGRAGRLGVPVVPIPGTKRVKWLEQNVAALDITLTADELAALDPLADEVAGARY